MRTKKPKISAIDLFCGAGGLSLGLKASGIKIAAGVDLDPECEYPYKTNLRAKFLLRDVGQVTGDDLAELWHEDSYRLLAGCAPCQPFSSHRRGADTSSENNWRLLDHFARLTEESKPDFVTMENVTRLAKMTVFERFVTALRKQGYAVDYKNVYGPRFGLPQERRRLVLVASRHGVVRVPTGSRDEGEYKSVRDTIEGLPKLANGEHDPEDPLHYARKLSPINLRRMKASVPGGTWADWPKELISPCHSKASGASFKTFYGRMRWDSPAPTITTQAYNFGTGRFGHPEQHRSLTLREAAMLQGFPRSYKFVPDGQRPVMVHVGRLIGNAVPPNFGEAIGSSFIGQARNLDEGM